MVARWFIAALLLVARVAGAQHQGDIIMGSTLPDGGQVTVAFDFGPPVVVSETVLPGLFTATTPGFDALVTAEPEHGLYPFVPGTAVTLRLVAAAEGVSVKVQAAILDAPGEAAVLPMLHTHPEWRLFHDGADFVGRILEFVLEADGYAASTPYALVLTTDPTPPTTTTTTTLVGDTTTTSTSTTLPAGCAGVPDGLERATCALDALQAVLDVLPGPTRHDRRVAKRLRGTLAATRSAVARAAAVTGTRRVRRLARARRLLQRLAARAEVGLPAESLAQVRAHAGAASRALEAA